MRNRGFAMLVICLVLGCIGQRRADDYVWAECSGIV
jgi:hypothetical protein